MNIYKPSIHMAAIALPTAQADLQEPTTAAGAPTRIGPVLRKPCVRLEPACHGHGWRDGKSSLFLGHLYRLEWMISYSQIPTVCDGQSPFLKANQRAKWPLFFHVSPRPLEVLPQHLQVAWSWRNLLSTQLRNIEKSAEKYGYALVI